LTAAASVDETGTLAISKTHDHRQVFAHLSTGLSFKIGQRSPDVRRKLYIPPEMSDNSDILARSWVDCCQFVTNDVEDSIPATAGPLDAITCQKRPIVFLRTQFRLRFGRAKDFGR
jgi:hypothetical protein